MSNASSPSSDGIGFLGLLTFLFVALKLCHVIAWPWVWVLAPTWIPLSIVILFLLGFGFFMLVQATNSRK